MGLEPLPATDCAISFSRPITLVGTAKTGNNSPVRNRLRSNVETSNDPDLALARRCCDPNSDEFEAAFEALYRRYRDRVYSIAYRITGNATDAMDVVQESFSLLFRRIEGFRGEALFSTWLFRIVVNCAIDSKRQLRSGILGRTGSLDAESASEPADLDVDGPLASAETLELGDHVQQGILRLSPKLRAILVLRYLEHQSYEQLSVTMDVSMGTIKSRLARAHLALQKVLKGTLEPFGFQQDEAGNYSAEQGPDEISEGVA